MSVVGRYRRLSEAQRVGTLAVEEDLLDPACEARATGWRGWERDVVCAEARKLGGGAHPVWWGTLP
jgi:hypothetical protein